LIKFEKEQALSSMCSKPTSLTVVDIDQIVKLLQPSTFDRAWFVQEFAAARSVLGK
jgi:hypothetical protein